MMPGQHVIASGITSAFFMFLTRSLPGTIVCFFSGILIDLDHILDYYLIKKKMCWSLKELVDFCLDQKVEKAYLVLHAHELMAVLWIVASYRRLNALWIGGLFGMSVHLLLDQIANPVDGLTYFWFYRSRIGFPKSLFFARNTAKDDRQI